MTSTRPWRRMILHFSHMGLTDGLTFTVSMVSGKRVISASVPALATAVGRRYRAEAALAQPERARH